MSESLVYENLINASIRFVSFRPRTEKEFRQYLARKLKKSKTYAAPLVDRAIERMRDLGYIDDLKFALWWIEQRQSFRPKGKRLILAELGAKGVSGHITEQAFSELQTSLVNPKDAATQILSKKIPLWKTYDEKTQKKKAYDFLYRRGFDAEITSSVVDDLFQKR